MSDNRERGQKASFCRHKFGTLMSTAMSGRKIAERASADFDMGAFISIRRPISLSRVAARGEWERGRERGERGLFWVSGGPNLSFPAGRKDATRRADILSVRALCRDPISRHLPLCAGVGSTMEAAKGRET